jgi:hypothetical protein
MTRKLRIVFVDGERSRSFDRIVTAPVDDVAAAISRGMAAFDEEFDLELAWIEQRSAEEAAALDTPHAA